MCTHHRGNLIYVDDEREADLWLCGCQIQPGAARCCQVLSDMMISIVRVVTFAVVCAAAVIPPPPLRIPNHDVGEVGWASLLLM